MPTQGQAQQNLQQMPPQQIQQMPQPPQQPGAINAATIDPSVLEQAYSMLQKLQDEQRKLSEENQALQQNLKGLSNKAREAKELEVSGYLPFLI